MDPSLDAEFPGKMEEALRTTFFTGRDPGYFDTEAYRTALNDNIHRRYALFKNHIVPWIAGVEDLSNSLVLEVGCGTGCCASALAPVVRRVIGFDIHTGSAQAFERRMEILGITNCQVVNREFTVENFESITSESPNAILLMATLEHMTFNERIKILRASWRLLPEGGILVVALTPNGLSPFDHHTSDLPFYHWLSNDVRSYYARRSPRSHFADTMSKVAARPREQRNRTLERFGIGVTYLDFEIALGASVHSRVIADGSEKVINSTTGVKFEDSLVRLLFEHYDIRAHSCFSRRTLQFILRKPAHSAD